MKLAPSMVLGASSKNPGGILPEGFFVCRVKGATTFDPLLTVTAGTAKWILGDGNELVGNSISHVYSGGPNDVRITDIDPANITVLSCPTDDISSLSLKELVNLFRINAPTNPFNYLSIANNPLMLEMLINATEIFPLAIDQIMIDLDNAGLLNGTFNYGACFGKPTEASLPAFNNLIGKGWTIPVSAPNGFFLCKALTAGTFVGNMESTAGLPNWRFGDSVETVGEAANHAYPELKNWEICIDGMTKAEVMNITIADEFLTEIDATNMPNCLSLNIQRNQEIRELDLTGTTKLQIMQVNKLGLSTLDMSMLTQVVVCFCQNNQLNAASIDSLIIAVEAGAINGGFLNWNNNDEAPSLAVLTEYNNLLARSWTLLGPAPQ